MEVDGMGGRLPSARSSLSLGLILTLLISGCSPREPINPGNTPSSPSPAAPVAASGPLPQPDQSRLSDVQQVSDMLFSIGPSDDNWQAQLSPDGDSLAMVTPDQRSLMIYDLAGGKPEGNVVLSWGSPSSSEPCADPWAGAGVIGLLGWKDATTLAFIAGEPDPGTQTGDYGIGVWTVDVRSRQPKRQTWFLPQGYRDQPPNRWLTADGKAAVLIHWQSAAAGGDLSTLITVVDLGGGDARTISTSIPVYESGGMSLYQRTDDGWSVAWQNPESSGAPTATDVHVLNLRTGEDRIVYRTGKDGVAAGFRWSPDGSRLAVFAAEPGDKYVVAKSVDDWTEWVAPKCIVVTPDGRVVAKITAPGDGIWPDAVWSASGEKLALYGADLQTLSTPDEYGQDNHATYGAVYVADLTGHVTKVASPPAQDTTALAAFAADDTLMVTYGLSTGCRTSVSDSGATREWSDLRPVLFDGRPLRYADGWLATRNGARGLFTAGDAGVSTAAMLPDGWTVSSYYASARGRYVLFRAVLHAPADQPGQWLFLLRLTNEPD